MIGTRNRWLKKGQQGVSLLLALLFVVFFGGVLVVLARFNSYEIRKSEARVTGWELVEIAKAARIYVRDQYAANPTTLPVTAATPQLIPLSTLKAGGYLSQSFGRSGGDVNALNQAIYVVMMNWSPTGLGGSPTANTTIPSAFVYFAPGGKAAPDLTVLAVENARRFGASITAPLFDRDGANRSADCRGSGPAVGLWDTGCMTQPEFAAMMGPIGVDPTFKGGGLIMPAWKAIQPDLRAVMRYPQPENPGYATMLTDLGMGTPVGDCTVAANQVQITTTDASGHVIGVKSDVCDTISDTAAADGDMRFNIDQVGNIMAERMIAAPQSVDFGGETGTIGINDAQGNDDDVMHISGNTHLLNDLRVYNVRPLPANVSRRFSVPNGTLEIERNAYLYSQSASQKGLATIGDITTANALISDRLDSTHFVSTSTGVTGAAKPQMNITERTTMTNNTSVTGSPDAEFLTETMNAPGATVTATDTTGQVQVTGTLQMNDSTMNVTGTAPVDGYTTIVGEITDAGTINIPSTGVPANAASDFTVSSTTSITAGGTRNYGGADPIPVINTSDRCLEGKNVANACPDRQYFPPNITP